LGGGDEGPPLERAQPLNTKTCVGKKKQGKPPEKNKPVGVASFKGGKGKTKRVELFNCGERGKRQTVTKTMAGVL